MPGTKGRLLVATPLLTDRDKEALRAFAERATSGPEMPALIRDRFLTIASHELRTPLNPLQLYVQMLHREDRGGHQPSGSLRSQFGRGICRAGFPAQDLSRRPYSGR